jgi:3-hydroxyacyl-CoA dehydrogenase/enoyl-CoA hydratase/3-hydroxybutyryl-CoA epimerase
MGGGIAQLLAARADVSVRLKDITHEPLASGMAHASGLFSKLVKRRRLSKADARRKMNLLRPTLDYRGFERCDVVIEAIVEILEVKQKVFAELAGQVRDDTILASNTSSLSIDLIGRDTPHPERVVGMHFFNPVHKMPLVEIIRGERTSPETVQAVVALTRRLGKTPVVVRDGPGFLVNRLLAFYSAEVLWLLDEGHRMETLDHALPAWGMPMGPIALNDEVGIDVANKVAHILSTAFPDRLTFPSWIDKMVQPERLGAKTQHGLYLYKEGRRTEPDPEVYSLLGIQGDIRSIDGPAISERTVLPMVNEAARCLEEGVADSPADIDLAIITGTGFPPFRGGLCRWADSQGLSRLVEEMERLSESVGARHQPSQAVRRFAEAGGFYAG